MTWTERHLLLLGLVLLICGQATATCYGSACPEQHERATAQGLLGDSLNAVNTASECSNKSYRAPEPVRGCNLIGVASIMMRGLHPCTTCIAAAVAGALSCMCLCPDRH